MSIVLFALAIAVAVSAVYLVVLLRGRRVTAAGMGAPRQSGKNGRVTNGSTRPAARQTSGRASVMTAPAAAPAESVPESDPGPPTPPSPPAIRWCGAFDPRSSELDERARLRLIGDLGVVAKDWCVPLLCAAYAQEVQPGHRQAALNALAACRSRAAEATFRSALKSGDANEAAIAADALADLEPPAQTPRRRTVERY